jgi:hypothetical protein
MMNRFPAEPRTKVFPWVLDASSEPESPAAAPSSAPSTKPPARRSYAEIDVVVADRDRDPRYEP